jgi:predicted adenine nucleotide alpha hydrolase (AANH) superfamily ATPase
MKKKLLLHVCCAVCAGSVLDLLSSEYNITVYCYNPNTMPFEEHEKRLTEVVRLVNYYNSHGTTINILETTYNNDLFLERVRGLESEKEGGERCRLCIGLRLEQTAKKARELGFELFTTTLSVSPHKNSAIINELGLDIVKKNGIIWLHSDFKKNGGFQKSNEIATKLSLYRQNYCGCQF